MQGESDMKKIIACVVAAAIVLLMLNALNVSPAHVSADSIFVDDEETASEIDQEALFQELFAPDSVIDIAVDISKEQLSDLQADLEYYRQKY